MDTMKKIEDKLSKLTLALVAHDAKKEDMVTLVELFRNQLAGLDLVATRSTGQLVQSCTGLPVTLMHSGPLGGDQHSCRQGHPARRLPAPRRAETTPVGGPAEQRAGSGQLLMQRQPGETTLPPEKGKVKPASGRACEIPS